MYEFVDKLKYFHTKHRIQPSKTRQNKTINFYSKTLSESYIHFPSMVDIMGRNANGKRVREPGSISDERAYKQSLCRTVNTSEYSIDVLTGKMSRLTIEDKKEPEEVIVWKGNYIVCD